MKELEEQHCVCVCVCACARAKFCCKLGKSLMGMMLKPRCNRRSGWGKGLLDQKSTDESVKDQGVAGCCCCCFFLLERHCPLWIYTTWSDGKQLYQEVLARVRDAVRRKRPELWENQTWKLHHDTGSRVPPHPQLCGKTSDIRCAPSTLFSGRSPKRRFPVSQT